MNCRILRVLYVGSHPFRLRACYRKSKRNRRWVEMNGEMIQIRTSRVRRRLPTPYRLPLRFDPLRERRRNRSAYPDLYGHYRFSRKSPWTEVRRSACKDKFHLELSWRKNDGKFWR